MILLFRYIELLGISWWRHKIIILEEFTLEEKGEL